MKRFLGKLVWLVLLAAFGGLVYWLMKPGPVTVEIGVVTRGSIEDYVTEEANTRLHTWRLVSALTGGVAARMELEVGDTVQEGQVITSVEDTQLKAMLDQARAQIKEAACSDVPSGWSLLCWSPRPAAPTTIASSNWRTRRG